jgi:uncharacterized membrane protein
MMEYGIGSGGSDVRLSIRSIPWGMALSVLGAVALITLLSSASALAQERSAAPGDVSLDMKHRSIVLDTGDDRADIQISISNQTEETLEFKIELMGTPEGWKVDLWEQLFDYKVTSMAIKGGETQAPFIRVVPPEVPLDDNIHPMTIRLVAPNGRVIDEADFSVRSLTGRSGPIGSVSVTSTFPVLRGTPNQEFEFEVSIRNNSGGTASFTLNAAVPANWEVSFVPTFGPSKVISTVSMIENGNRSVKVRVQPGPAAAAGVYPITVTVGNELISSSTPLQVTLIGRGELAVTTGTGMLNLVAAAGEESPMVFQIVNVGTGDLTNLVLNADAPRGWQVTASPDSLGLLPPQAIVNVQVTVIPTQEALPGDYLVTLRTSNPQDSASLDVRVTVTKSTIWGWVGIGIVVFMVAGLVVLFARVGRR